VSKTDRLKEEISFHKQMFFAAVAVSLAFIAWAFNNFTTVSVWLLSISGIALLGAFGFGYWNYREIRILLEELEDA
jgi:type IV secretory pathway TrbL component